MARNGQLFAASIPALLFACLSCGFIPAADGTFPQVSDFGGKVLSPLRVVTITTGGDPMASDLAKFGSAAVQSQWWQSIAAEYDLGDPAPKRGCDGSWTHV